MHSCEFWESFKNYVVVHLQTATSDIFGYRYIWMSSTRSTLKKYTVFSSILVFIYFKLILEFCTTSGLYVFNDDDDDDDDDDELFLWYGWPTKGA